MMKLNPYKQAFDGSLISFDRSSSGMTTDVKSRAHTNLIYSNNTTLIICCSFRSNYLPNKQLFSCSWANEGVHINQ